MRDILAPDVLEQVQQIRPDLSKEQAEAVSVLFASSAATLNQATQEIPAPFNILYGANLFAVALLPLYMEHNLVNVDAIVDYTNKIASGEIKLEEEAEEQDRKARPRGKIGFQFGR
jgi:anaerobic C4-dicarboxylate transporter